jgi:predicted TPR repeat methyltransferase
VSDLQTRALSLLQEGRADEAAELLTEARAKGDARIDGVLALALQLAGRLDEAAAAYRRAIRHAETQLAGLHFNLGTALAAAGDAEDAAAAYTDALALAPDLAVARMNLGTIHHQKGRLDDAEAAFRAVLAQDPDDTRARTNLGAVLCAQRRFADAEAELAQAATGDDDEAPRAQAGLAVALTGLGRHAEAIAAAEGATMRAPELAEAHEQLAAASYSAGEHARAIEAAKRALELEESATVREILGASLNAIGELEGAAEQFRKCAELNPRAANPWRNLGAVLDNLRDRDGAIAAYREVLAREPDDDAAWKSLAGVLSRKGEVAEAVEILERMQAKEPDDVSLAHLLASLRGDQLPAPPPGYVTGLFDQYAPRFDQHLVKDLGYIGPAAIAEVLGDERALRAADLGCGTGMVGERIRAICDHLIGVDLSPKMLDLARGKGVYDELMERDIVEYVDGAEPFDLVTAADVLIYVGDPAPLFAAVAKKLRGRFAFTIETGGGDVGWHLERWGRYSHSAEAIEKLGAAHGLAVDRKERLILRHEQSRPVDALVYVLRSKHP